MSLPIMTGGLDQLDHLKADCGDGEFGIKENHFSSPEVNLLLTATQHTMMQHTMRTYVVDYFLYPFSVVKLTGSSQAEP